MTGITAVHTVNAVIAAPKDIPIVGAILDDLMKKVTDTMQQTINSATNAVLTMEYEAGRQVQLAIQNAKEAYIESLQVTIDKVDKTVTDKIDQLNNMVQVVQQNNKDLLAKAAADAQQIILSLPFSSKKPQLTSINPQSVAIDSANNAFTIKFGGVFPWSDNPQKYPTSFTVNDQDCSLLQNTTQQLAYQVPFSAIPNTTTDKCAYVMAKLQVTWDKGWIFTDKQTAEYNIGLGVLPLSPGKITAYYTLGDTHKVQKAYTSPSYHYDGNSWYPTQWVNIPLTVPPEAGWRLDTSVAPSLNMHGGAHGNHTQSITGYDENGVQVAIGLQCSDGKHMGIIDFDVSFKEYQYQADTHTRTEDIDLRWGNSKILEPQTGETIWKIAFQCFDGSYNEFGPADIGNKYLQLINENGTIRLAALVPTDL